MLPVRRLALVIESGHPFAHGVAIDVDDGDKIVLPRQLVHQDRILPPVPLPSIQRGKIFHFIVFPVLVQLWQQAFLIQRLHTKAALAEGRLP